MNHSQASGYPHPTEVPAPGRRHAAPAWVLVLGLLISIASVGAAVFLLLHQPPPEGLERTAEGALRVPAAVASSVANPAPSGATERAGAGLDGPHLEIPELGIVAPIGADLSSRSGAWLPPLYELGRGADSAPLSADTGTVMLAGHVWVGQAPGVFADLHKAQPGNVIFLDPEATGEGEVFIVSSVKQYPNTQLPEWVWGSPDGPRGLVLVTCAGEAVGSEGQRVWSENLVIEAIPLETT